MNKIKITAITYSVLIALVIIFPPVRLTIPASSASRGFSAIWKSHNQLGINMPFLLIELFAVTAICTVIYFFVVKEK